MAGCKYTVTLKDFTNCMTHNIVKEGTLTRSCYPNRFLFNTLDDFGAKIQNVSKIVGISLSFDNTWEKFIEELV